MAAHEQEAAVRTVHCQRESRLTLERAVLGLALLSRPANAATMVTVLTEADFLGCFHQVVFRAIKAIVLRNELPIDYAGVIAELQRQGSFEQFENARILVCSLGENIGLGRTMISRCEQIKQLAQERRRRQALQRDSNG